MCRYGIPYTLIADNRRQFDNQTFREFYNNLGVELRSCSLGHPKANRQVKAANKTIKKLLKTRLREKNRAWVDELSSVLWAYRTTHKTVIGETSFALAFGHEVIVPAEAEVGTHRIRHFDEEQNDEQMCLYLDLLVEKREVVSRRIMKYQQMIAQYCNKKVWLRQFRCGDWVLKSEYLRPETSDAWSQLRGAIQDLINN